MPFSRSKTSGGPREPFNRPFFSLASNPDIKDEQIPLEDMSAPAPAPAPAPASSPPVHNGEAENATPVPPVDEYYPNGLRIPPADGGLHAWLFLAACSVFEALIWGLSFSFGVFQSYYSTHPPFSNNQKGIAAIGTCSIGVMYLFTPISLYVLEAYPWIRRFSSVVGLIIAAGALIASSFSTQVWHLIVTQGAMYATGGSLLYLPSMFYLDEWFVKKKGFAFGVMWASVGASGLVFPFLLQALLDRYDFANTLRIWAIGLIFLCTPLIFFIKPRLLATYVNPPRKKPSYVFLFKPTFLLLQASNVLESLGFFLPAIYLPTYAASIHLSPRIAIMLLSLLNLFSVVGAVILGFLSDRMHIANTIAISTAGSTFAVFIFWGIADEVGRLTVFAMMYGTFAGGYWALSAGMMKEVQKIKGCEQVGTGVLMGVFAAGRGIGAVVSGPLSEVLLDHKVGGVAGFDSRYGAMIVFTGVSAAAGGVGFFVSKKMRSHVVAARETVSFYSA